MTPNELTPDLAAFIEAQTSIFLATASAIGQPYIQHRGPPRFLRVLDRVLDDKTPGNGTGFHVHISLTVPRHETVIVNHAPSDDKRYEHIEVAIKDAFAAARRQLDDLAQQS